MVKKEIKLEQEQILNETVSLTYLLYLSRKIVCICSLDLLFWFTNNQTRTLAITICKDLNNLSRDMRLLIFQILSNAYLLFTANISRSNALFAYISNNLFASF